MTRMTSARIAGVAFLASIGLAFPSTVLFREVTGVRGVAERLAGIAHHTTDVRFTILLSLFACFTALVLGATLYAITRDADRDLAVLALCFRVGEGVLFAPTVLTKVGLLWLATAGSALAGVIVPDATSVETLGAFLLKTQAWSTTLGATFFAVGSALFSFLLLRGRTIPVALARLGLVASLLLVVGLPLQLVGILRWPAIPFLWLPMVAFELPLGAWLIVRGAAAPAPR